MQIVFVLTTSYYYLAHCPVQSHNSVHVNPCLQQLQRPLQYFLQLYLISSLHASDTSDSSFHSGTYPILDFFHPHPTGETGFSCLSKHWFHKLACDVALRMFCFNAPAVGGIFLMLRPPLANRIRRDSFIFSVLQLGLYSAMKYFWCHIR